MGGVVQSDNATEPWCRLALAALLHARLGGAARVAAVPDLVESVGRLTFDPQVWYGMVWCGVVWCGEVW